MPISVAKELLPWVVGLLPAGRLADPGRSRAGPRPLCSSGVACCALMRIDDGPRTRRGGPETASLYVSAPVWPSGDWLPSGGVKCMTELDGWFGLATHPFPGERMPKHQFRSMEKLPFQADPAAACAASVLRVANDRMADRRKVGADLVRAPRLEPHAEQRGAR